VSSRFCQQPFDALSVTDLETYASTRNPQLREQLILRHMPLVKFQARRMAGSLPDHIAMDDLISMGAVGLMDAIEKFDPARGLKFSTYAITRIRGEILDGLQRMEWAPKQTTSKVRAVRRVVDGLRHEHGLDPTVEQIAAQMGATEAEVRGWLFDHEALRLKPLEGPLSPTETAEGAANPTWFELSIRPEQDVAGEVTEIRARVARALRSVDGQEKAMLLMYYRDGRTLKEIAVAMGISSSSAIQSHTRAIEKVRANLSALS
jgi:RNA polymerase sigma factor FliA